MAYLYTLILLLALLGALVSTVKWVAMQSGQTILWLVVIFLLKWLCGMAYGWLMDHRYNGGDFRNYRAQAHLLWQAVQQQPAHLLELTFEEHAGKPHADGHLTPPPYITNSYGTGVFIGLLALLWPVTGGNHTLYALLMAIIVTAAGINLLRACHESPRVDKYDLWGAVFLLPSVLFWCSGVHKDGLMYWGLSSVALGLEQYRKRATRSGTLWLTGGCILLAGMRPHAIAAALLAIAVYGLARRYPRLNGWYCMGIVLTAALLLAELLGVVSGINVWQHLLSRQATFSQWVGGSHFSPLLFTPDLWGVLAALPQAMLHAATRPWPAELGMRLDMWLAFAEGLLVCTMVGVSLLRKKNMPALYWLLLTYALATLAVTGLVVNNVGAICRYRATAWAALALVGWYRLQRR